MYSVEFQAQIINGSIKIPEIHKAKIKHKVKVILLTEDTIDHSPDIIDELLACPIKLTNFKPLKREDIYERS